MTEPTSDARKDALERAIEVLVLAPLGAGLYVRDLAPSMLATLVARGRAEVDRTHEAVSRRVTTARSLGQVALAFGVPMARQRVRGKLDEARSRATDLLASTGLVPSAPTPSRRPPSAAPGPLAAASPPVRTPSTLAGANGSPADAPPSSALPIPGYDALSASQVVERLAGLAPGELDAVRAYELAHRNRRTILGKIEQLAG
jgi:hypothetical protein